MKKKSKIGKPAGVDKAYIESGAHLLGSEKLEPYTPSRIVAAQAMGLKYPNIGQEGVAQLKKTGLYPGELRDVIIVLYLCRLTEAADVLEAQLDPVTAYAAAEKWAGTTGLCAMGKSFQAAVLIFEKLLTEIDESKTVPTGPEQTSVPDDEGDDPND